MVRVPFEPKPLTRLPPFMYACIRSLQLLDCKQHHGLVQTLGLDSILHEVCLRDDGRDGKTHRDSHTAQCLRVLGELLVAAAHAARVEVGAGAHGREVQHVDAGLGEHEDADAGRFPPDAVEVVPGRVAGRAVRKEGRE